MENMYDGLESIKKLNNELYIRLLIDLIDDLGIVEKADKSCNTDFFKDNNMYEYNTYTTLIYNNLNTGEIYQTIIDIVGNYIVNRYYHEKNKTSINNIFSQIHSEKFKALVVDGMTITRLGLSFSNDTDSAKSFFNIQNTELAFIIVRPDSVNYKNYHITVNDVLRARDLAGKTTFVFFNGTKKYAKDNDYYYVCPKEIDIREENPTKVYDYKKRTNTEDINLDDVLNPKNTYNNLDDVLGGGF